jgi:glycosyltransferase involved in cell wall biosynthesis
MDDGMEQLTTEQLTDLNVRTLQGRENLTLGNIRESLQIFINILRDYPNDLRTLLTLGDVYLASNQPAAALQYYSNALNIDPKNVETISRIKLAAMDFPDTTPSWVEKVPTSPHAVNNLLQELTESPAPIAEEEIRRAADLLEIILQSSRPGDAVKENLDNIDNLLPALIEINIRQAIADGRPDLASALGELQENINLQRSNSPFAQEALSNPSKIIPEKPQAENFKGRISFLHASGPKPGEKIELLMEALKDCGCEVSAEISVKNVADSKPDILIVDNPHTNPEAIQVMAAFSAARVPILLNLDCDFEELPLTHPNYSTAGLRNPEVARAYLTSLTLADRIIVPSKTLAEILQPAYSKVEIIPEFWSKNNELWTKNPPSRSTVNLGWINTGGNLEDLASVRRVIVRVLRQFPETRLVIAGDMKAYQLFDSIPESRKLYLPSVENEDLPYLLSQIDILLVPMRNTAFNRSGSDALLMNSGAKRIPWIASPIPAFTDWNSGGIIATSVDEWHVFLSQLINDPDLRKSLGDQGYQKAGLREINKMVYSWLSLIKSAVDFKEKNGFSANHG